MTTRDLTEIEQRYRMAALTYEKARKARNLLVTQALEEGWTLGKIAGATGLSRTRIAQIKHIQDEL